MVLCMRDRDTQYYNSGKKESAVSMLTTRQSETLSLFHLLDTSRFTYKLLCDWEHCHNVARGGVTYVLKRITIGNCKNQKESGILLSPVRDIGEKKWKWTVARSHKVFQDLHHTPFLLSVILFFSSSPNWTLWIRESTSKNHNFPDSWSLDHCAQLCS